MLSDVFKPAQNRLSPKKGPNFDVFGPGDPQDVNLKKNTCWEGTSLDQTASFEPTCVKLSLLVWSLQVSKKKKAVPNTLLCATAQQVIIMLVYSYLILDTQFESNRLNQL